MKNRRFYSMLMTLAAYDVQAQQGWLDMRACIPVRFGGDFEYRTVSYSRV